MNTLVYDLESLPNIFTAAFSNGSLFEISWMKNEVNDLINFLSEVDELVGFNNLEFDYPLLHFVIENRNHITAKLIHEKSTQLVKTPFGQGWRNRIWDDQQYVKQIDLRLIHHLDNINKLTSLKALQFAMKLKNIKEFSHGFDSCLSLSEIGELKKYNVNDVESTVAFFNESKLEIDFRREFEKDTGIKCMNFNDGKLGEKYFEKELEKKNPGCIYTNGKKNQTPREPPFDIPPKLILDGSYDEFLPVECHLPDKPSNQCEIAEPKREDFKTDRQYKSAFKKFPEKKKKLEKKSENLLKKWSKDCDEKHNQNLEAVWIPVKDILFDYVSFERPEFKEVLEAYRNYNITKTKGGFKKICTVNGFNFVFGQGGIHGSIKNSTVRSNDEFLIRDIDISGAYPDIAIKHGLYPLHLGEKFCGVYKDVFERRKKFKKGTALNKALKLSLNSVFGNSLNEHSIFCDPLFGMQITINGQLLLAMLTEQLMKLDGLRIIQINTDGLTFVYPRKFTSWVESVEKWWMDSTKLNLENVNYKAMFVRDVNNYISWAEDGSMKRKGAFGYDKNVPGELGWHKNHSGLIVPKAAEAFLTTGVDVDEFICNHNDPFDFMMRGKVNRTDQLVTVDDDGIETEQQTLIRFYFSKLGSELFKYMPPLKKERDLAKIENREPNRRRNAYQGSKGRKIRVCNHIEDFGNDIDYSYYISEAQKLIDGVSNEL